MKRDSWNAFHDGVIRKVNGIVPGRLEIAIEIKYLRRMFDGSGTGFVVTLEGCTLFSFAPFDEVILSSLLEIEARHPEILSIDSLDPLVLGCSTGDIKLAYEFGSIWLDTGEPVSDAELEVAASRYWTEWEQKARR